MDVNFKYREYQLALEEINFSDEDTLYVLGDVIDRGEDAVRILQDMMYRPNIIPIVGNHEYMAMKVLKKFCVEITEENVESRLTDTDMLNYMHWIQAWGLLFDYRRRILCGTVQWAAD